MLFIDVVIYKLIKIFMKGLDLDYEFGFGLIM